jgi:DNA-binding HxlR family transcriptional regulator
MSPCHDAGMQKYRQYCPVARASEILADRWTPLIVRELILGSHRFNEIERGLPGISRSLLSSRLRDLEDAGVVERLPDAHSKVGAYQLSEAGRDLKTVIESLGAWGVRWAFGEPRPEELARDCWSGGFTSVSIASCCRTDVRSSSSTSQALTDDACGCCSSHARFRSV